jgi:transposase
VFLPPYSPELQPAERLWPLVDEAVANRHFATLHALDAAVARRCRRLDADAIRPHTDFRWWPRPATPH